MRSSFYRKKLNVDLEELQKSVHASLVDGSLSAFLTLMMVWQAEKEEQRRGLINDGFAKNTDAIMQLSYQIQVYEDIFNSLPKGKQ